MPYKPPERPAARNVQLNVRMRPENKEALRQKAYAEGLLLGEWARFILLRELEPKK